MPDSTPLASDNDDTSALPEPEELVGEDGTVEVEHEVALKAWADEARMVLIEVAGRYNTVMTSKELAAQVQARTGISTTRAPHYWIGDVLRAVAQECAERDEPLLSSLCVNPQGGVLASYSQSVLAARGETLTDPDDHASHERLACHQHHGATGLPENGGRATLTPRLAATRTRERKNRLAERVLPVCPKCNHVLASTGECDNCD